MDKLFRTTVLATALIASLMGTTVASAHEPAFPASSPVQASSPAPLNHRAVLAAIPAIVKGGAPAFVMHGVDESGTWSAAAGVADIKTGAPAQPDAEFRIGSISKTFVAVAVLQLAEAGRIGLDTPIGHYLPGLLARGDVITIRELLEHRAGLASTVYPGAPTAYDVISDTCRGTFGPVAEVKAADQQLFEPGTAFNYANAGYTALELVIEKVTGKTYQQVLTDQIVRPLGLQHTSFQEGAPIWTGPFLHGYEDFGADGYGSFPRRLLVDQTKCGTSIWGAAGSGISTASDLTVFMRALMGGRLIDHAMYRQMIDGKPAYFPGDYYGFGIVVETGVCGRTIIGNGGTVFGYQSDLWATADGSRTFATGYSIDPGPDSMWTAINTAYNLEICGSPAT